MVPYPPEVVERYRSAGLWTSTTVGEILQDAAATWPERTALVAGDLRLTYRELDAATTAFAEGVRASGLQPGDAALFQMGNCPETAIAYYGCVKAGVLPVCTLPQHRERELTTIGRQVGARGYFVQADFRGYGLVDLAERIRREVDTIDVLVVARGDAPAGAHAHDELAVGDGSGWKPADPLDVAVLQLSGGTTGVPKVIPRLHDEYVCNARAWADSLGWDEETVVLHPLPLIHNAGISAAMQPAHLRGATFVLGDATDAGSVLETVEREGVTDLPVVPPAILLRILDHPDRAKHDLSSLRRLIVGGQRLAPETAERMEQELGLRCLQMFGMTEGMFLRTADDDPVEVRHHTVGRPIHAQDEVRVLEPGSERDVAVGEVGELCCRGPYTIRGYLDSEEHNRKAFTADGFYRTGDLARAHPTADGGVVYSIDGRIKDMINRGVEKINAEEVENVVVEHPAVHAVAVVAMPDRELGEKACAYIVLEPGAGPVTLESLREFLAGAGLAKYKWPERVEVVDAFPLTNVGKVSKVDLRADIARRIESEQA